MPQYVLNILMDREARANIEIDRHGSTIYDEGSVEAARSYC